MNPEKIIQPPYLSKGDCIGLFSPSGPVRDRKRYESGIELLQSMGFRIREHCFPPCDHDYLAADDKVRAEEFHSMWADPDIHCMMAVRGGYGCLRMMPYLDMAILRENPKQIVGFSDLTVLLNTLADRAGIITLHGPVLTSLASSDSASVDSFVSRITGVAEGGITAPGIEILREGTVSGTALGGNLTTIAHLLGTPWEIPFKNTLLLLEDTGEPMYKIDRILTQLYVSGRLDQISGILLGTFDSGQDTGIDIQLRDGVWNRVLELTARSGCPVWGDFPIGHLAANLTFPLGVEATMDSSAGTLFVHNRDRQRK